MTAPQRRNGNGVPWSLVTTTISTLLAAAAFLVGMRLGVAQEQARMAERYISVERYQSEQLQILSKLDKMERKIDSLVRAVERNTARLETHTD